MMGMLWIILIGVWHAGHCDLGLNKLNREAGSLVESSRNSWHALRHFVSNILGNRTITTFKKLPTIKPRIPAMISVKVKSIDCLNEYPGLFYLMHIILHNLQ